LAREPLVFAGAYGGRFGGWSGPDADLDLVLAWPSLELFWERGEMIKEELRAIAADEVDGLELDFAQGPVEFMFEGYAPEDIATFFVGPTLAGDPAALAPEALVLAHSARTQGDRACLAATKRATDPLAGLSGWKDPSFLPPNVATVRDTLEGLAAAWGYLRLGGKDRRPSAAQVADLLTAAGSPGEVSAFNLEDEELISEQLEPVITLTEQVGVFLRQELSARLEVLRRRAN